MTDPEYAAALQARPAATLTPPERAWLAAYAPAPRLTGRQMLQAQQARTQALTARVLRSIRGQHE